MSITQQYRDIEQLRAELALHEKQAAERTKDLRAKLAAATTNVRRLEVGLDQSAIARAEAVLFVAGSYAKAGEDRASARSDAIRAIVAGGGDMWDSCIGTKSYAGWHGQRCDCGYGFGPRHGSIIFNIGFRPDVLRRDPRALTETEIEDCVYYLTHIETIQASVTKVAA